MLKKFISSVIILSAVLFSASCGGVVGDSKKGAYENNYDIPVLNNLEISDTGKDYIELRKPTFSNQGSPDPTVQAYIGVSGTMSISGSTITGYVQGPIDVSNSSYLFSGLSTNTEYKIVVIASNSEGYSVKEITQSTSAIAPVLKNLVISGSSENTITLEQPAFSIAGNPIPAVKAYIGLEGTISVSGSTVSDSVQGPVDVSSGDYQFAGLNSDTAYTIIVVAENTKGYSVKQINGSTLSSGATGVAPVLNDLDITSYTSDSITLKQPTFSTAGTATVTVRAYIGLQGTITESDGTVSNYETGSIDVSSGDYQFTGLSSNTGYTIFVVAENSDGKSVKQIDQSTSEEVVATDPPAISYSTETYYFTQGVEIETITPTVTNGPLTDVIVKDSGGNVTNLPDGLSIDTTTGVISGTPTSAQSLTTYTVTAVNGAGSAIATVKIFIYLPDITNFTATSGEESVTLNWDVVANVKRYYIAYGTTSDCEESLETTTTNSITITNLDGNTTYYFVIFAIDNNSCITNESNCISAIPSYKALNAPSNITATSGDESVLISWPQVKGASSYKLYCSTSSGVSTSSTCITGVTSTYTHSGLTNGTTYYYRVSAVKETAESDLSDEVNATPSELSADTSTVTISNLANNSKVETGFIVGTSSGTNTVSTVEVSLDGGSWESAAGTTSWSYKLPTGGSTWRLGSSHTIRVRSKDSSGNYSGISVITVKKGKNKDINGDGFIDLVVVSDDCQDNNGYYGCVYVFYSNGSAGISATSYTDADCYITGLNITTTGDINGDGYADLVGGNSNSCSMWLYNNLDGIYSWTTISNRISIFYSDGDLASGSIGITIGELADCDLMNYGVGALALGDFNNDGYDDLVTSYGRDSTGGEINIIYSDGNAGITVSGRYDEGTVDAIISSEGVSYTSYFGYNLAVGDFDGDGNIDLATTSYGSDKKGRVYIFRGGNIQSTIYANNADFTIYGKYSNGYFGSDGICFSDINNDGYDDLTVLEYNTKKLYFYNSEGPSGFNVSSSVDDADLILSGDEFRSMNNITFGDINGDGYEDVVLQKMYSSADTFYGLYVLYNNNGSISETPDVKIEGECEKIAVDDLNGDGFCDIVTGYSLDNKAYIFYSDGSSGVPAFSSLDEADNTITGEDGFGYFLGW